MPLSEDQNIVLLEKVVADQRTLLADVFNTTDVTTIPQVWTLCTLLASVLAFEVHPMLSLELSNR